MFCLGYLLLSIGFISQIQNGSSFSITRPYYEFGPKSLKRRINSPTSSQLSMCICINCKFVTNCQAYHFVEERHDQPHMNKNPTFTPRDGSPTIHVNIRSTIKQQQQKSSEDEEGHEEIGKMWREYKDEEKKADENDNVGLTTYDLSDIGEVTYEYDVVGCEDYVEDMGCWIRNMPQEIRDVNPDFVPT